MQHIEIENFPAHLVDAARAALAKVAKRGRAAAARQGAEAPAEPSLEVAEGSQRVRVSCSSCQCNPDNHLAGTDCRCGGVMVARRTVTLLLLAPTQRLAGWEFLAVIEPLVGGNLIRKVPGAEVAEGALECYRSSDLACGHCSTRRRRSETFVVRHEDGRVLEVGRSCLADFLGGKSAASVISSLAWERAVRELGESDGWGPGATPGCDPTEFLSWVAAVVRRDGWTPKSAATQDRPSTAGTADYLMNPPWDSLARAQWRRDREEYAMCPADQERATAVLAWARALEPASDYERNLSLVARQEWTAPKHLGILASALSAYERAVGAKLKLAQREQRGPGAHVGAVGERLAISGTVERVATVETQYGNLHVHTIRDAEGRAVVWKTGSRRMEIGAAVAGKATVKRHSEWKGELQTEISRPSF